MTKGNEMRRVVIGVLVLLLFGCVGVVAAGYFYGLPWLQTQMEEADEDVELVMTAALYQTMSKAITESPPENEQLRIRPRDLSVNNAAVAGEAGWETGTAGTLVYGFEMTIVEERLALGVGNQLMYSGAPVIIDNRLELTEIRTHGEEMFETFTSAERFEHVIETGLNQALRAHEFHLAGVSLQDDELVITVASTHTASRLSVTSAG